MSEVVALGWGVLALLAAVTFVGTLLQRLAGQGFGMLAAPVLALVAPSFLPATILLTGLVIGLSGARLDSSAIARHELPPGFAGRIVGAVVAAWIVFHVSKTDAFGLIVALTVLFGVALSLAGIRVAIGPVSLFVAAVIAGVMSTLTGVGAPPMALLYQHEEARRSAAMQNTFFLFGMVMSIGVLAVAGLVRAEHLVLAAVLTVPALAAVAVARPLSHRLARASIRPVALGLASCAALVLLVRSF